MKHSAKVELLFRGVIPSCQLHLGRDYKYTLAQEDKIALVLPSGELIWQGEKGGKGIKNIYMYFLT